MHRPNYQAARLSSAYSPEMRTLLTKMFPPDPIAWAQAHAQRCASSEGRVSPWPSPMPGLSELGQIMATAYQWELHQCLAPDRPNPHASQVARCFNLEPAI